MRKQFEILSPAPNRLYRAFTDAGYAIAFISGMFSLPKVSTFRNASPPKGDAQEGRSEYVLRVDGEICGGGSTIEFLPTWCLSMARSEVCLKCLRREHGKFLVEINEPQVFIEQIAESLMGKNVAIIASEVDYSDETDTRDENESEKLRRECFEKPTSYRWECEYRILLRSSDINHRNKTPHYFIDLGKPIHGTRLI